MSDLGIGSYCLGSRLKMTWWNQNPHADDLLKIIQEIVQDDLVFPTTTENCWNVFPFSYEIETHSYDTQLCSFHFFNQHLAISMSGVGNNNWILELADPSFLTRAKDLYIRLNANSASQIERMKQAEKESVRLRVFL